MRRYLETWADAKIHDLTTEEWRALNRAAAGEYIGDTHRKMHVGNRCVVAHTWAGGLRPDYQTVTMFGRALLAARDRVLAGLTKDQRYGVAAGWPNLPETPGFEMMQRRGVVDEYCELTPLGRELVRCIREAA